MITVLKFLKSIDQDICDNLRAAGLLEWTFKNEFLRRELLEQRVTRSRAMTSKLECLISAGQYPEDWRTLFDLSLEHYPRENQDDAEDSNNSYDSDSTNINSDEEWAILNEDFDELMTEYYV